MDLLFVLFATLQLRSELRTQQQWNNWTRTRATSAQRYPYLLLMYLLNCSGVQPKTSLIRLSSQVHMKSFLDGAIALSILA